jgi:hypothetical protein
MAEKQNPRWNARWTSSFWTGIISEGQIIVIAVGLRLQTNKTYRELKLTDWTPLYQNGLLTLTQNKTKELISIDAAQSDAVSVFPCFACISSRLTLLRVCS